MNKFKSLILLLLLVPCMLVLSARGGTKEGDNGGDLGDNNNGNYAEINFDEDYIKQHMPSEYQISFSVVGYANNQVFLRHITHNCRQKLHKILACA